MSQDKQLTELNNLSSIPNSGAKVYVRDDNEPVDVDKDKQLDLSVIKDEIDTKAPASHGHSIAEVAGLQGALDAKEPTVAAGTTSQYYRGDKTFQPLDKAAVGLGNVDNTSDANKPISVATQSALNNKADASHTHSKSDITDFNDADYAPSSHGHSISEVAGLQTELNGKAASSHTHTLSDITDFSSIRQVPVGSEGQVVGFDASGNPIAQAAPSSGGAFNIFQGF